LIYIILFTILRILDYIGHPIGGPEHLASIMNLNAFLILFSVVIISLNPHEIKSLIKAYVYLTIIMSFFGILSWWLVNFDFIQDGNFKFSLFENSHGKYNRDKFDELGGYTAPYYLGLVLTASYEYSIMGFSYYRASGWAHEPTSATLFIVPAMLLLFTNKSMFHNSLQPIYFMIVFIFWLVCSAMGSIISLIVLGVIASIFYLLRRGITLKFLLTSCTTIIVGIILLPNINEVLESSTLIKDKFQGNTSPFIKLYNFLFWIDQDNNVVITLALQAFVYYYLFIGTMIVLKGKNTAVCMYGYICLYIVIHGAKGSWIHISMYIFSFFFFYVAVFASYRGKFSKSYN